VTQGDFITYMGGWDGWMAVPSWDGTLLFCCLKLLFCCQVRSQISGGSQSSFGTESWPKVLSKEKEASSKMFSKEKEACSSCDFERPVASKHARAVISSAQ